MADHQHALLEASSQVRLPGRYEAAAWMKAFRPPGPFRLHSTSGSSLSEMERNHSAARYVVLVEAVAALRKQR